MLFRTTIILMKLKTLLLSLILASSLLVSFNSYALSMMKDGCKPSEDFFCKNDYYEVTAEKGNLESQHQLGLQYLYGHKHIVQDYVQAVYWQRKAAEQGHAEAQYTLGWMYLQGQGVEQDLNQTVYWFKKSVKQGNAKAQNALGQIYLRGVGVEQNNDLAMHLIKKAARQGSEKAKEYLRTNNISEQETYDEKVDTMNVAKGFDSEYTDFNVTNANMGDVTSAYNNGDYKKTFELSKYLSNKGVAEAKYWLGWLYSNGKGVNQDYKEAIRWYTDAANQGSVKAQYNLARLYSNKIHDYKKAAYWLTKAAEQGVDDAQNNLAIMYNNGQGVKKDYKKAVYWYTKAAEQGLTVAQRNLDSLRAEEQLNQSPHQEFETKLSSKNNKESLNIAESVDTETIYYPTGEIEAVGEVVNGKLSKSTQYYKTGEVEGVIEYVNGKLLKATRYYKTGEIQQIEEYINGKKSKVTFYFKTGEVSSVEKYPIQSLGKKDSHISPISKEIKDNQNSFPNKVSNKKIVMSCVGGLFKIDPGADLTRITPIETYWKDIVIKGDTLIAPKFGEYLYHREENGKKYWQPDGDFSPGSPFSKKWNWATLDTNTDKFDISLYKEGMIDLMQGKCSIKTKTNWN